MSKIEQFKSKFPDEYTYLAEVHEGNNFFTSLMTQADKFGSLSIKQIACIQRNMGKDDVKQPKKEAETIPASFSVGDKIEIKNWIAKKLEAELELPFFFRNLIVEEHHAESHRAVQLSVRFEHTVASSCHVCGRALDDPRSKAIGIGPTCSKRMGLERMSSIGAEFALKMIKMQADKIGVVGPVWIPKSQVALRDTASESESEFLDMMNQLDTFGGTTK